MSIDARIKDIIFAGNNPIAGKLVLIDRPPSHKGQNPGIAGQSSLHFQNAPANIMQLVGKDIWGGSETIMLGDCKIAERVSMTMIVFVNNSKFDAALEKVS